MDTEEINYTKEAFLNTWNLTFLVVALVTAVLASGGPDFMMNLVLLLAAAFELLYLGIAPQNERFQKAVRAQRLAERHKQPSKKAIYRQLTRSDQRRYARLRNTEKSIRANYSKLSYASQGLLESHLGKIDGLLNSFLHLLYQKDRYRSQSDSATESEVRRSIAALRESMEEEPSRVQSINRRRMRVLEQRLESFQKSHENLKIIEAQLETIADVIKFIHEQSWTLKDPEEVSFQLDTLLDEVEETQASVAEVEEIFNRPFDLLDEMESFDVEPAGEKEQAPSQRSKTRR